MNQCDGCLAGKPTVNGMHQMGGKNYADWMTCQSSKYAPTWETVHVRGEVWQFLVTDNHVAVKGPNLAAILSHEEFKELF